MEILFGKIKFYNFVVVNFLDRMTFTQSQVANNIDIDSRRLNGR